MDGRTGEQAKAPLTDADRDLTTMILEARRIVAGGRINRVPASTWEKALAQTVVVLADALLGQRP